MATGPVRRLSAGAAAVRVALARVVTLAAAVVALILVAGILLVVLKANRDNALASTVRDGARALAGPFDGLFPPKTHKVEVAVNWGIAAVVWYAAGHLIARVLRP